MKKIIFMATIVLAANLATAQTENKDEQAVRTIFTTLEKGWNAKSGETFSSVFADVHDYIVVNGFYFPNFTRQRNAAAHQQLFDGRYKTYDIKLKVDKVSFIRPDLAQAIVIGAGAERAEARPADPNIIMTTLIEKKDGQWKIISFHNHNLESFNDKANAPFPLNVMYASWYKN